MDSTLAGRYKLLRRLAAGGMGEVYLAAQAGPAGFEKVVALKRLLPSMGAEGELIKLFLDEARLVAKLAHRNICQIFDLGQDGEGYFVAMEYIQGPSVRALLDRLADKRLGLPPALAVEIAAQVADALSYAYSAPGQDGGPLRIIHRDVTPQNILLSVSGDVKLIDFGVAKSADQRHVTQGGTIKGKLAYMSPEQSRGVQLDGRSDLFSLGIVLHEMLTGQNPFVRADLVQTVMAIQSQRPAPPSSYDAALAPADLVVGKLLAPAPGDRFPDAGEAYEALVALRPKFPKPPKRLGPFVTEHFGEDVSAVTRSVSDSGVRAALRREADAPAAATPIPLNDALTPATYPEQRPVASSDDDVESGATFVRQSGQNHLVPAAPEPPSATAPPRRGLSSWSVAGLTAIAVVALGSVMFFVVAPRYAQNSSGPESFVLAARETGATVEPTAVAERQPAPAAAEAKPSPAPPPAVVAPFPTPVSPPMEAKPPQLATTEKPTAKPHGKTQVRPPPPKKTAAPRQPPPVAGRAPTGEPLAALTGSGPMGPIHIPLRSPSGKVILSKTSRVTITLNYVIAEKTVTGTIETDPWTLVWVDEKNPRKTPRELPPLSSGLVRIELGNPSWGDEKIPFALKAQLSR